MSNQVRWGRDQRAMSRKKEKALAAVAVDGNGDDDTTGRCEITGLMDIAKARFLFFFGVKLFREKEISIRDAFEETLKEMEEMP